MRRFVLLLVTLSVAAGRVPEGPSLPRRLHEIPRRHAREAPHEERDKRQLESWRLKDPTGSGDSQISSEADPRRPLPAGKLIHQRGHKDPSGPLNDRYPKSVEYKTVVMGYANRPQQLPALVGVGPGVPVVSLLSKQQTPNASEGEPLSPAASSEVRIVPLQYNVSNPFLPARSFPNGTSDVAPQPLGVGAANASAPEGKSAVSPPISSSSSSPPAASPPKKHPGASVSGNGTRYSQLVFSEPIHVVGVDLHARKLGGSRKDARTPEEILLKPPPHPGSGEDGGAADFQGEELEGKFLLPSEEGGPLWRFSPKEDGDGSATPDNVTIPHPSTRFQEFDDGGLESQGNGGDDDEESALPVPPPLLLSEELEEIPEMMHGRLAQGKKGGNVANSLRANESTAASGASAAAHQKDRSRMMEKLPQHPKEHAPLTKPPQLQSSVMLKIDEEELLAGKLNFLNRKGPVANEIAASPHEKASGLSRQQQQQPYTPEVTIPGEAFFVEQKDAFSLRDSEVVCGSSHITVNFRFKQPLTGYLSEIGPDDKPCVLHTMDDEDEVQIHLSLFSVCAPLMQTSSLVPIPKRQLLLRFGHELITEEDVIIQVHCDLEKLFTEWLHASYEVYENTGELQKLLLTGLALRPLLFLQIQYKKQPLERPAFLGEPLSLYYTMGAKHLMYDTDVLDCWVFDSAPNKDETTSRGIHVIHKGCPVNPVFFKRRDKLFIKRENYNTVDIRYYFRAFRMEKTTQIWFKCKVRVCYEECGSKQQLCGDADEFNSHGLAPGTGVPLPLPQGLKPEQVPYGKPIYYHQQLPTVYEKGLYEANESYRHASHLSPSPVFEDPYRQPSPPRHPYRKPAAAGNQETGGFAPPASPERGSDQSHYELQTHYQRKKYTKKDPHPEGVGHSELPVYFGGKQDAAHNYADGGSQKYDPKAGEKYSKPYIPQERDPQKFFSSQKAIQRRKRIPRSKDEGATASGSRKDFTEFIDRLREWEDSIRGKEMIVELYQLVDISDASSSLRVVEMPASPSSRRLHRKERTGGW